LLQQLATGSDERSRALRERFDVADLTVEKLPAFLNQILFSTNNLAASAAFTNDLPIDILSFAKRRFPSNCYARINRLLLEHAYPGLHPRDGLTNDVVRNWIALDDALCTNLVRELQARGVATSTSTHDVIAFVSEADSFYGRSLPKAFGVALTNSWGGNATNGKTPVLLFGYLRGLDGSKPKPNIETPKRDNLAPTPENFLLEGLARQTENAEGESQTDYGQRLAQQLRAKYDEARLAGGHMAVGLAGNDVYDKLLLLRALKFKLPEAVFFTTDLDARMWMPRSRLHYTRNLIVASAQPVTDEHREVGGSDERDSMPAFRDVYQTTIYRACRAAIADRFAERPLTNEPRDPNDLAGKIFEIGRSGPVILSDPAPYPQFRLWWLLPAGIAALYLLMTILIAHLDMARIRWFWIIWPVLHVLLLAGFIWYAQCVAARAGEEPWAPDSGTSIWSTEIIRVGLIALACQMLSLVFIQHRQLRNFLWKRFFADTRSPRPVGGPISATEVFEHYCIRGKTRWRLARAGGLTFAYFGAVALISYAAGQIPQRLCIRGSTSRNLDLWVLLLAVCITLLILFLALDASQLTTQMLSQLAGRATKWPRRVLRDFAKDKLVALGHLFGWLDVHFAAVKTTSTRNFISMPFILIFLLILSRLPYFENWTWPPLLIAVFAINFGLTLLCWAMVRGSAATLRKEAAARLATIADRFANVKGPIRVAGPGFRYASTGPEYSRRLRKLIEEINEQRDGAYARWFQDPTFVALLIPTGATGVIAVLLQYWLTHS
jgi:hypothetical protein